jgi:hypothetical protein
MQLHLVSLQTGALGPTVLHVSLILSGETLSMALDLRIDSEGDGARDRRTEVSVARDGNMP